MRALAACCALLLGCGSSDEAEPFAVTPTSGSLRPGETLTLAAGPAPTWTSSDPAVATVSFAGVVAALSPGTATITARSGHQAASATATITVLSLPAGRWGHGLVDDAARARLVLFGGSAGERFFGDTWLWDGGAWQLAAGSGPSPRDQQVMAFDSTRARVVLFGGRLADSSKATDTWEWDGTRWERLAESGPPAREHAAGGFDRGRGRFVLFGGQDPSGATLTDTWEWDGNRWERRATTVPGAAQLPSRGAAYSAPRQRLLLAMGDLTAGTSALWEWDGSAWTAVPSGGLAAAPPILLTDGAAAGEAIAFSNDGATRRWDGGGWTTLATSGPPARFVSAIARDAARGTTVLFGGAGPSSRFLGDTWVWDGAAWAAR